MDDVKIFNQKPFYILLIEPGKINHLDWNSPTYLQTLTNMPIIKSYLVESDKFFEKLHELLKIGEESDKTHFVTECISEEPGSIYEIIFTDTLNKVTELPHNELASLVVLSEEQIKGNAVIIKTESPSLNDDMIFGNVTSNELHKILRERGFATLVAWEDGTNEESLIKNWREEDIYGDMETYANKFFEDEPYKKIEIGFLKHNLNIWYLPSKYGMEGVCGNLITEKIEKCFVFTMLAESMRGNITKDEIFKIFELSKVLEVPYTPDNKWYSDEIDKHGRKIIKNKYKVLDNVYQENLINKIKI